MSPNELVPPAGNFCAADKFASQTPIYVLPAVSYFYPSDKLVSSY